MNGDPKLEASQVLPPFDYAAYARLIGLHGIRVERPEDVGAAWDEALAAGRPAVIDVVDARHHPPLDHREARGGHEPLRTSPVRPCARALSRR
jgi:pyruvate dehydrogenase (quinone)